MNLWSFLSQGSIRIFFTFKSSSNYVLLDKSGCINALSFGDTKKFSNFGCSFWAKSSGFSFISKSWDLLLSLLSNNTWKHFNVRTNNTSSDWFSLSLSLSFSSVSSSSWRKKKFNSVDGKYSLFHCKSITIKSASNLKYISFELFTKVISFNLLTNPLFKKVSPGIGVINSNTFSCSLLWTMQTKFHN